MYGRVLLAYDGSREGRAALREGAVIARRFKADVFLLCVSSRMPDAGFADVAQTMMVAADKALFDEAMARLRDLGFSPHGDIVHGEPVVQISRYAAEIRADLVVVGHRRVGFLERWWSGSSGAYLTDHIGCSVLVARNELSDDEFWCAMALAEDVPIDWTDDSPADATR